jgi:hypothetical protein
MTPDPLSDFVKSMRVLKVNEQASKKSMAGVVPKRHLVVKIIQSQFFEISSTNKIFRLVPFKKFQPRNFQIYIFLIRSRVIVIIL